MHNTISKVLITWYRGVVVITAAQLHSVKSELRPYVGSSPVCGVLEIRNGKDLWQWFRLEIKAKRLPSVTHTTNYSSSSSSSSSQQQPIQGAPLNTFFWIFSKNFGAAISRHPKETSLMEFSRVLWTVDSGLQTLFLCLN